VLPDTESRGVLGDFKETGRTFAVALAQGKLTKRTHGRAGTRTWDEWRRIKRRCRTRQEALHGPWAEFESFYRDMGKRPPEAILVRLNVSGPWVPDNCKWERKGE